MKVSKGIVVQIKEYCHQRIWWKISIVTEIHPGRDGIVRAFNLRLAPGSFIRQTGQELYTLELDSYIYKCLIYPTVGCCSL